MKKYLLLLAIVLVFSLGCGKKTDKAAPSAGGIQNTPAESTGAELLALQVVRGEIKPGTVLVDVDGKQLTAGDAKMLIEFRVASIINQIPPERADKIKASMLKNEIEQFVHKHILLNEANRQNITATKEDQDSALEKVAAQLPAGMTIDQAIDSSPWGRENMMNEMVSSIKIGKLLKPFADNPVDVTPDEIQEFYRLNKEKLDRPERVRIRHILINSDASDSAEVKAEKRKKLENIRQSIEDGADFARKAEEVSECASGKMGGDLGEFTLDSRLSPAIKDAAFSQETGKTGPVIESEFGYHILEVTDHKEASAVPVERLNEIVRNTKKQEIVKQYIEDLRTNASIKYPVTEF